jgi:hypothetical protein
MMEVVTNSVDGHEQSHRTNSQIYTTLTPIGPLKSDGRCSDDRLQPIAARVAVTAVYKPDKHRP